MNQILKSCLSRILGFFSKSTGHGAAALLWLTCHPAIAEAGILSRGICRPYKQLVDNELFVVLSVVVAAILVIMWKVAPSGQLMARALGLLAALAVALNLENVIQQITGVGLFC